MSTRRTKRGASPSTGEVWGLRIEVESALRFAMENDDWGYLAEYLREDGDVTPALRAYLTDVLNKKKRARRRPPSVAKQTKDLFLAMMVVASERMGATPREAIKIATDLGGADRSTVQRAVKECRGIIEQGIEEARDGDDILI